MDIDASPHEIASRFEQLADLIDSSWPKRVPTSPAWPGVGFAMLARIAGQARTLATLVNARHDIDGLATVRSLLEHAGTFAWLACEPDEESVKRLGRPFKATTIQANVGWWQTHQLENEKRVGSYHEHFGGEPDPDLDAAWQEAAKRLGPALNTSRFPSVRQRMEEVDAHWAPRLLGWSTAPRGTEAFVQTYEGFYLTLYYRGSGAVHPDISILWHGFTSPLAYFDHDTSRVHAEHPADRVDLYVTLGAFVVLSTITLAHHLFGWPDRDEALRIMDRYDDVAGPAALLQTIHERLPTTDTHMNATTADGRRMWIARRGAGSAAAVANDDHWLTVVHDKPGGAWRTLDSDGQTHVGQRATMTGEISDVIRTIRESLEQADFAQVHPGPPTEPPWPDELSAGSADKTL